MYIKEVATPELTLQKTLELAQKNYPAIRRAQNELLQAQAGIGVAKTAYLPSLNLFVQNNVATYNKLPGLFFPQPGILPVAGPSNTSQKNQFVSGEYSGALLTWNAYDFGYRHAQVEQAKAGVSVAEAIQAVTELDVLYQAATAFLGVQTAERVVKASDANVRCMQVFADNVAVLVKSGLRPGVDQSRAIASLAAAKTQAVKAALPSFRDTVPSDVKITYEFDQSGDVINALTELLSESATGAILTGLMVLLFLRCWRSTLIVVTTIPIALLFAVIALAACGQTINTTTLGDLALAVGVLVDEATATIENIHSHLAHRKPIAQGVYDALSEIVLPKLLAMLCILAVFVLAFLMSGGPRALFIPLALAVGFSMIASFLLLQTLVPIMSIWLLGSTTHHDE